MRRRFGILALLPLAIAANFPRSASAQSGKIGVQVRMSTLGIGGEVGVRIHRRANLRAGFHLFNYDHTFGKDGVTYDGRLRFRSITANLDWYLAGPFHISPGVLLYDGSRVSADASVPAGQTFTLGNTTYESSTATPLSGSLAINVKKAAPEMLIGFGNLIPRNGRRFTVNLDAGVVFQGAPASSLNLSGLACIPPNSTGPTCVDAATNSVVQANVQAQQAKLDHDFAVLRYYPVLSFGIGYRF